MNKRKGAGPVAKALEGARPGGTALHTAGTSEVIPRKFGSILRLCDRSRALAFFPVPPPRPCSFRSGRPGYLALHRAPMKRRWRKWLFTCLGLLGILLLGHVVERIRGQAALNNRLTLLLSQGEKLKISDWEPEIPRPEENAAVALFALTDQMDATSVPISVPSRRVSSPGFAIVGHRLREWYADKDSTNRWGDVAARLKDQAPVMESAKKALDRPKYHTGFDYQKGFQFELPTLTALPRFMRDLNLETLYELHQTNMNAAYASLIRTIHFAAIQGPEALMIFQLVRQPLATFACNSTWEALQTGRLTDEQLRGLQAAWSRFDFIGDMTRGIEMERAMALELYAQMRQSKSAMDAFVVKCDKANELGEHTLGSFVTHGAVRSYIQLPLWRVAWCHQDSLISLNNWQALLERHRKATQDSWASLENASTMSDSSWFAQMISPTPDESLSWSARFRYPFSSIVSGRIDPASGGRNQTSHLAFVS